MLADVQCERAIIGCLIKSSCESYYSVADFLSSDSFLNHECSSLYHVASKLFEEGSENLDAQTIMSKARSDGLESIINIDMISDIKSDACINDNLPTLSAKVRKLHVLRLIQDQLTEKRKKAEDFSGEESINDILSLVEIDYSELISEDRDIQDMSKCSRQIVEDALNNPVDQVGISTGYPTYDAAVGGGLRGGSVNFIGARMKVGKSTMSNNMGINIAELGIPVLYVDTEMRTEEQVYRCIARMSGVKINEIETGKFGKNSFKRQKVEQALDDIEKLNFHHVSVAGMPFEQHIGIITRWIRKNVEQNKDGTWGKFVVVYDYLKLTSSSDISNNIAAHQALGFMTTTLHNLSVRYDFPIIGLVQLNRDGINKESTDIVAGSDEILRLCTSFSIFKHKSKEEIEMDGIENGNRKLIVLLARHGEAMEDDNYINIAMDGSTGSITELNTRHDISEQRNKKAGPALQSEN